MTSSVLQLYKLVYCQISKQIEWEEYQLQSKQVSVCVLGQVIQLVQIIRTRVKRAAGLGSESLFLLPPLACIKPRAFHVTRRSRFQRAHSQTGLPGDGHTGRSPERGRNGRQLVHPLHRRGLHHSWSYYRFVIQVVWFHHENSPPETRTSHLVLNIIKWYLLIQVIVCLWSIHTEVIFSCFSAHISFCSSTIYHQNIQLLQLILTVTFRYSSNSYFFEYKFFFLLKMNGVVLTVFTELLNLFCSGSVFYTL